MAQNDHRINAQGMDRRHLRVGQIVELTSGKPAMLIFVVQRMPSFKGFVQFMAIRLDRTSGGAFEVNVSENQNDAITQAYHSSIRRILFDVAKVTGENYEEAVNPDGTSVGQVDFDTYVGSLRKFRLLHNVAAPTDLEIEMWKAEWRSWSHARRVRELERVETSLIISGG